MHLIMNLIMIINVIMNMITNLIMNSSLNLITNLIINGNLIMNLIMNLIHEHTTFYLPSWSVIITNNISVHIISIKWFIIFTAKSAPYIQYALVTLATDSYLSNTSSLYT